MNSHPTDSAASPRRTRVLAAGVVIESLLLTPVLVATDIALDGLSRSLLLGSLALLVIALPLRAKGVRPSAQGDQTKAPRGLGEGIGRYRPQLGRGDAD